MTQHIEEAMEQDIEQLTWMSPETKKQRAREAARHREQGRLSGQLARLQLRRDQAR